eukprot:m.1303321 g.1303321  ORF g.1303321 m.1303321 type:complete len:1307 (-) comp24810_c0_seq15:248-4168(-)
MSSNAKNESMFRFAIDRGGTFTDVYAECPGGKIRVLKLLSEDPSNYADAPREGIRRILELETGCKYPRNKPVDESLIEWIRMGTTVATNALLERKGERVALVITSGFRDILHIGTQARPRIFDVEISTPDVLYEEIVQVSERIVLDDDTGDVTGSTGEKLRVEQELDEETLRSDLKLVFAKGIRSVAVVLMHSYLYNAHELRIAEIARELGFTHVSLSSEVMRMAKIVPRGYTCCADAYLTPCIQRYVHSFAQGFQRNLENVSVLFMQSDGGLSPVADFNGARAILSGPAGGVVGFATTAYSEEDGRAVIGFDMGGTSTDVSRYAGTFEHVFESTTAGVTIQAPQLDINTVAAGGGSRLFFRAGMFVVGPESAGAHPGPTCYRKGGPLTITDANVFLGRINPKFFPHIFGESEDKPIDIDATSRAFHALTAEINAETNSIMTPYEVAMGFVRVANEAMCRPIRALTQAKGHNTTTHILSCFGGAGGQHACAIARSLGMAEIVAHQHAGILSAVGLAMADVVNEQSAPCAATLAPAAFPSLMAQGVTLADAGRTALCAQGLAAPTMTAEVFLNLRYAGTDCAMMTPPYDVKHLPLARVGQLELVQFTDSFSHMYMREFGFVIPDREILVDDIRVRVTAHGKASTRQELTNGDGSAPPVLETSSVYFEETGVCEACPLYRLESLLYNHRVQGPAVILAGTGTIVVEPGCTARVTRHGDLRIVVGDGHHTGITTELNSIHLSIFGHRFMSIAEQMGRALQRTSISVNIKERLDFSCAVFSPDGGLVANAPHIPVHLGAMQEAVRFQIQHLGDNIHPGDVLLSNHPAAGGSHLPDITVMTPVFVDGNPKPVFFVASRGHHADIGGITPGSMPPNSTSLNEEGAAIMSFKLKENDRFNEEGITALLQEPACYPNSSGTRKLSDNLSDLRAQVAANQRGIVLVNELVCECGLDVVLAYMGYIQANAESAVRDMLREVAAKHAPDNSAHVATLHAEDFLDDGSPIRLAVTINKASGDANFDFAGTGLEILGNLNAPRAVTYSAVIYCLRCMVGYDIPLNQGCLNPVTICIPPGTLLHPGSGAAVVGGNVLTSQRVTDVVLKAFGVCAASQGCMNNTTYGDSTFGYYETVAGGAGAGPTWHGRSGVHTHMTNTRITDPEVLERRYPVVLEKFMLRDGSGGDGAFVGGDGVVRHTRFRKDLTLSVLSERRSIAPYGLCGGANGQVGLNVLVRKATGQRISLGSKCTTAVRAGDVFELNTPGGGGYGTPRAAQPPPAKRTRGLPTASGGAATAESIGGVRLAGGSLGKFEETQLGV